MKPFSDMHMNKNVKCLGTRPLYHKHILCYWVEGIRLSAYDLYDNLGTPKYKKGISEEALRDVHTLIEGTSVLLNPFPVSIQAN